MERILLADADLKFAEILKSALEASSAYEVMLAVNGAEAYDLLFHSGHDFRLGIVMEDLPGVPSARLLLNAAKVLPKNKSHRTMTVLLVQNENALGGKGIDEVIFTKPFLQAQDPMWLAYEILYVLKQ